MLSGAMFSFGRFELQRQKTYTRYVRPVQSELILQSANFGQTRTQSFITQAMKTNLNALMYSIALDKMLFSIQKYFSYFSTKTYVVGTR